MPNAFTAKQRTTLTTIVDTYVASVPRDDDPTGFFAAKGSDLGTDAVVEQYLIGKLPAEQFAGLQQLLDTAELVGLNHQPLNVREVIVGNLSRISPETTAAMTALYTLSVLFSYSLPGGENGNPLWAGMGYPGPAQLPPQTPKIHLFRFER